MDAGAVIPVLGSGMEDLETRKKTTKPCSSLASHRHWSSGSKSYHEGKEKIARISNGQRHGDVGDEEGSPLGGKARVEHEARMRPIQDSKSERHQYGVRNNQKMRAPKEILKVVWERGEPN